MSIVLKKDNSFVECRFQDNVDDEKKLEYFAD